MENPGPFSAEAGPLPSLARSLGACAGQRCFPPMIGRRHPDRTGRCDRSGLDQERLARRPLLNFVELQSATTIKQHPRPIQTPSNDDPFAPARHLTLGTADLKPATVPGDRPVVLHGTLLFEDENVLQAHTRRDTAVVVD